MKKHIYHFLITNKLKTSLIKIKELDNLSFSKKIIFILNNIDNIINLLKEIRINEDSKVEYLMTKTQAFIYMDDTLYKKLKRFHARFNSYSIAIVARLLIKIFVDMVEKYGFKNAIKKIRKQGQKLKKVFNCKSKKNSIIQFLKYLGINDRKNIKLEIILLKLFF